MTELLLDINCEKNDHLAEQLNQVIDHELRPRLRPFDIEISLLEDSKNGLARIKTSRVYSGMFSIHEEVLKKIVVSALRKSIPQVQKMIIDS